MLVNTRYKERNSTSKNRQFNAEAMLQSKLVFFAKAVARVQIGKPN
ncbi:hypothetical protein PNI0446_00104 [Streptococcus pneumoniae PNI0446]|nr:hypothetical protein PNI0446_00104 [Streptococcus pneumoniae PNI0446]